MFAHGFAQLLAQTLARGANDCPERERGASFLGLIAAKGRVSARGRD